MSESINSADDPWLQLDAELDAWALERHPATFWWRDDDAVQPGPKLERLIELSSRAGLLLAVIPAKAEKSLASMLINCPHVHVAQHGYAHINHAPRGQGLGAWELGLHRGERAVLDDLDEGRKQLSDLFGSGFLPVVVPPWNRIATELLGPIAKRGYSGVSAFGQAESSDQHDGLVVANAHCDPIRWKSGATFAGEFKTISQLLTHLESRRAGRTDISEHTGFLTHHIDLDNASWEFCTRLITAIDRHASAQWVSPVTVFKENT